jgi:hypothetical protein
LAWDPGVYAGIPSQVCLYASGFGRKGRRWRPDGSRHPDHLLETDGDLRRRFLDRLGDELRGSFDRSCEPLALRFTRMHPWHGEAPQELIGALASRLPEVFQFIGSFADTAFGAGGGISKTDLINAALWGASGGGTTYAKSDDVMAAIEAYPEAFSVLTSTDVPPDQVERIAAALGDLDVTFDSLEGLSQPIREAVREKGLWLINRTTLTQLIAVAAVRRGRHHRGP